MAEYQNVQAKSTNLDDSALKKASGNISLGTAEDGHVYSVQ